jgi:heme-degrading monooxygenase HmoA
MSETFAVLYRWTLVPGTEADFVRAWQAATLSYRAIGALGSRLHRAEDGSLYAYAEWPSRAAWEAAGKRSPVAADVGAVMKGATATFSAVPLTIVADLLGRAE